MGRRNLVFPCTRSKCPVNVPLHSGERTVWQYVTQIGRMFSVTHKKGRLGMKHNASIVSFPAFLFALRATSCQSSDSTYCYDHFATVQRHIYNGIYKKQKVTRLGKKRKHYYYCSSPEASPFSSVSSDCPSVFSSSSFFLGGWDKRVRAVIKTLKTIGAA